MTDSLWRKRQEPEALKLALEALENLEEHLPFDWAFDELQSLAGKDEYRKDLAKARSLIPVIYESLSSPNGEAQPEQEQIAVWLETKCDEQYLADRVRAGDYAKEKGHTENRAALADNCPDHLPPSLVGVGEEDYMAQPEPSISAGPITPEMQAGPTAEQKASIVEAMQAQPEQPTPKWQGARFDSALHDQPPQPEQDNTYGYASRLATAIWQKHYMKESPKFALLDTTEGVLTQIDNMTCGLVREKQAQPEQEPVALQMDVIVVNLVREGINKHRARELAEHFIKHTTPPQRKPLTDGEIWDLHIKMSAAIDCKLSDLIELTRAVEAAHGIKE